MIKTLELVVLVLLFNIITVSYAQLGIYILAQPHPVVIGVVPNPTIIVNGTSKNITVLVHNKDNITGEISIDGRCGDAGFSTSSFYNHFYINGSQELQINMTIHPSYNLSVFGGTFNCSLKASPFYNDGFNSTPYTWIVKFNPESTHIHIANITGCISYGSWWGNGTAVGAKPYNLTILNYTGKGNNYSTVPGVPSLTAVIVPYGKAAFISASLKTIQTGYRLSNQRITFCIADGHTTRTLGSAYTDSNGIAILNYDTTLMNLNQTYSIYATYGRNFSNQGDVSGGPSIYLGEISSISQQKNQQQQTNNTISPILMIIIGVIILILMFFILRNFKNKSHKHRKDRQKQTHNFCSKCGTKNSIDAKFCKKCGKNL